jgi:all-trans-retinol 13,14-reductase
MIYDALVVGAGFGGLISAAKIARAGRRVLVLEKNPHVGGTSYIFRRGGYYFPMGPLSFSHPERVKSFFGEAGIETELDFKRNHFHLLTPFLDIIYSRPLEILQAELRDAFPDEMPGLSRFFADLGGLIRDLEDIDRRHPDFLSRTKPTDEDLPWGGETSGPTERIEKWAALSSADYLGRLIGDPRLRNFLGSQGTTPPKMSMLNLAFMWRIMADKGIWFPANGIHGLCRMLAAAVSFFGGEIRISAAVEEIIVRHGRATGVRTAAGDVFEARRVISNADYKKTFLEMIDPAQVPPDHLEAVRGVPYSGSEICVYLGIDPARVDFSRMKAEHLFYRRDERPAAGSSAAAGAAAGTPSFVGGSASAAKARPLTDDFDNREIEICRWSDIAGDAVPAGRASLVLRADFSYAEMAAWRTGEKMRKDGYRESKNELARKLIRTVEHILPGLSSSIEVMDVATPLTYRDWGQRTEGSIAGWTWAADPAARLPGTLLVETPVENLFMAGIYAAKELFLGGIPTALYTGSRAADLVLDTSN